MFGRNNAVFAIINVKIKRLCKTKLFNTSKLNDVCSCSIHRYKTLQSYLILVRSLPQPSIGKRLIYGLLIAVVLTKRARTGHNLSKTIQSVMCLQDKRFQSSPL